MEFHQSISAERGNLGECASHSLLATAEWKSFSLFGLSRKHERKKCALCGQCVKRERYRRCLRSSAGASFVRVRLPCIPLHFAMNMQCACIRPVNDGCLFCCVSVDSIIAVEAEEERNDKKHDNASYVKSGCRSSSTANKEGAAFISISPHFFVPIFLAFMRRSAKVSLEHSQRLGRELSVFNKCNYNRRAASDVRFVNFVPRSLHACTHVGSILRRFAENPNTLSSGMCCQVAGAGTF